MTGMCACAGPQTVARRRGSAQAGRGPRRHPFADPMDVHRRSAVVSRSCAERRLTVVGAHMSTAAAGPATGGGASYASWTAEPSTIRVPFSDLRTEFTRVLAEAGVPFERAELVGKLIAENQLDGVYSHGLNRFPKIIDQIKTPGPGQIDVTATPEKVAGLGALEQWDGKTGLGPYNAHVAMARAIQLANEHGLGLVALRNTNHWQRGGAYGLQAADAGCVGVCWTNTSPNMPAWGTADVNIGNNPVGAQYVDHTTSQFLSRLSTVLPCHRLAVHFHKVVIAIPRQDKEHVLLDMATSQFANGKLEILKKQGAMLALPGARPQRLY
eukprot:SAG31_NODE_5424_length_2546_cov_2.691050_2_plen_326_part_00